MKIIHNAEKYISDTPLSLCIGNFDGFHRGHISVASKALEEARKRSIQPALLTFNFNKKKLLTTHMEKVRLFENAGFSRILILPEGGEWMSWGAEYFSRDYLSGNLRAQSISVGEDFRFGRNREGNPATLKKYSGAEVSVKKLITCNRRKISSTLIRELILSGDLGGASELLGRWYFFAGSLEKGEGEGRVLGYPTFNFRVPENKLLPSGVFSAELLISPNLTGSGEYGPCFIGNIRVGGLKRRDRAVEIHLLSPLENMGGVPSGVRLIRKIREPLQFKDREELIHRIQSDIEEVKVDIPFSE